MWPIGFITSPPPGCGARRPRPGANRLRGVASGRRAELGVSPGVASGHPQSIWSTDRARLPQGEVK